MAVAANLNIILRNIKDVSTHFFNKNCPFRIPTHVVKMAATLTSVFACMVPLLIGQTSIAVFKNSTDIFAASDSKGRQPNGDIVSVCKVDRLGNLFWSQAGKYSDYKPLIRASTKGHSSIRQTVDGFSVSVLPAMKHSLVELRRDDLSDYKHFMQLDGGNTQIIFFGMEKNVPVVASIHFVATEDSKHKINIAVAKDIRDSPTDCHPGVAACGFTAGRDAAIRQYMASSERFDLTGAEMNLLIRMEVDADPAHVGLPIRILRIDSDGPRWIQHGEGCHIGIEGEN